MLGIRGAENAQAPERCGQLPTANSSLFCMYLEFILKSILSFSPSAQEPEPGIPGWAPPRPRSRHVKGVKVPCPLCAEEIIAPLDHLAYQHGIDTPRNQYTTREAHIKKMRQDIVVQHLVQDGAELNRLRGEILDVEGKLKRLDASYRSGHGLPLHVVYEIHRDHPSFALNGESGQTKQALVEKLRNLRLDGLSLGRLYSNSGRGTYSEVLADLKQCLAQREWPPAAAHWDGEKYQHTGNKEDA